jgi:hypothetical protein
MESDPYGHLAVNGRPMKDAEAAAMIGMDLEAYKGALYRLEEAGIPSRTQEGMLYSRRLVRDHERFIAGREAGRKGGGNPRLRGKEKGKKPEARIQNPEAKAGIKVPFIGPPEGSELAVSHSFQATWKEWVEYRRGMKAVKNWSKLFQKQVEWLLKYTPDVAAEILNVSMRNGWTGLFDPSRVSNGKPPPMVNHI